MNLEPVPIGPLLERLFPGRGASRVPPGTKCDCCGLPFPEECRVMRECRQTPEEAQAEYGEAYRRHIAEKATGLDETAVRRLAHERCGVPLTCLPPAGMEEWRPATKAAREFLASDAPVLLLIGPKGCGKSVSAAVVLAACVRKHGWNSQPTGSSTEPFLWAQASELTSLPEWNEAYRQRCESLRAARLLVLDDVGDEGTSLGKDAVANLLLGRYAHARRTVLTSNLTWKAFGARYGAALADRLREGAMAPDLSAEKSLRRRRDAQ